MAAPMTLKCGSIFVPYTTVKFTPKSDMLKPGNWAACELWFGVLGQGPSMPVNHLIQYWEAVTCPHCRIAFELLPKVRTRREWIVNLDALKERGLI